MCDIFARKPLTSCRTYAKIKLSHGCDDRRCIKIADIVRLKKKIQEKGLTVQKLAVSMEMNPSTFYRKIKVDGESFTVKEVELLSKALHLSVNEVNEIFFGFNVA